MKWLKFKRTFVEGWRGFFRDGWLSFATVSVLVLSLYIMSVTVIFGIVVRGLVGEAEKTMNVSVYFETGTNGDTIRQIQAELQNARGIASVEYVTSDQALQQLRTSARGNDSIDKSLEILGENPLRPALVIHAEDSRQYERIVSELRASKFSSFIYDINYAKNKSVIDRLTKFIASVEKVGISLGAMFVFIAVLITYNAIRLSLYANRQEFEIMRLVGASNIYIKMPLLFEGVWFGVFAAIATFVLLLLTAQFVSPLVGEQVRQGTVALFLEHSVAVFLGLLLGGIVLGILGGWIAVRRYLKI